MKLRKLSRQLINKSKESFLLALEIFNKPTVSYRIEAFSIFYTNAWELLLKAKVIENSKRKKDVFRPKIRNKPRESISIDECLNKIFPNTTEPVRKNIEDVSEIRNFATHLVIPEMEDLYSGLFQQGVFNYIENLRAWFGEELSITPRMMTLVFDFQPDNKIQLRLKRKYPHEISTFYEDLQNKIVININNLGSKYSIPINHKLALVKSIKKSDIVLGTGTKGFRARIIEVAKDSSKTHPYLTIKLGKEINSKFPKFNTPTDLYAINFYEKIDKDTRPDFVYKNIVSKSSNQYSEKYKEFVIKKIQTKGYLDKVRRKYKQRFSKIK